MEYLIGLFTGLLVLIVFISGIFVGMRFDKKQKPPDVDEKEVERVKKFNEDFQQLFSYDVAKATERKRV